MPGQLRNVPLPFAQAPCSRRGALASESRTSDRRRSAGGSKKGSPAGLSAHSSIGLSLRPIPPRRAQRRRRTGGHADPPTGNGVRSHIAHARQSGPAEAVVPGSALRAAVISNCPALGRRKRVGRGFPVAARRYPGVKSSRADETAASPCGVEVSGEREKHGPDPSPLDRLRGTEPARGAGPWDCEAAERKVQWRRVYL